jgi:hypothetical protein
MRERVYEELELVAQLVKRFGLSGSGHAVSLLRKLTALSLGERAVLSLRVSPYDSTAWF